MKSLIQTILRANQRTLIHIKRVEKRQYHQFLAPFDREMLQIKLVLSDQDDVVRSLGE